MDRKFIILLKEEIKQKVLEIKRQKDELNEYLEIERAFYKQAEKQIKSENAKYEILNFQQRDFQRVIEKMEKAKQKEINAEKKEKRLERLKEKVKVEHDSNRLYQMTSVWTNHINTPRTERSESCGQIFNTPRIQHLAVPSWRQGI